MPISNKFNLIYIDIPNNGISPYIKDVFNMNGEKKHAKWYLYRHENPSRWENYFSFAVVRNPFERAVLNYKSVHLQDTYSTKPMNPLKLEYGKKSQSLKNKSFREVIRLISNFDHPNWQSQSSYVLNGKNSLEVDYILKIETLYEDIKKMCNKIDIYHGLNFESIEIKNLDKYRNYYDQETKEMVKKVYQKDLETFNYSF